MKKIIKTIFLVGCLSVPLSSCSSAETINSFESKSNEEYFTVTFVNYDDSILEQYENVKYGTIPSYNGKTPERPKDAQYTYTFSTWEPKLQTVTSDITYKAQYSSTINTYNITWKNWDGEILKVDENIEYGAMPSYDGTEPSRDNNIQYSYSFDGWQPEISSVKGDAVYTAVFKQTTNEYDVGIVINDPLLGAATGNGKCLYGNQVTLTATPTEDNVFVGWYADQNYSVLLSNDASYTFTLEAAGTTVYAKFLTKEDYWDFTHGVTPIYDNDTHTMIYGLYPQTIVDDRNLISDLDCLTQDDKNRQNGYYFYNDEYYYSIIAHPNNNQYTVNVFSNGKSIVSETQYWFKCEPIVWKAFSIGSGKYTLLSEKVLFATFYGNCYAETIYDDVPNESFPSSYTISQARARLMQFYNQAFALNKTNVEQTNVNNSASTTRSSSNTYVCKTTEDYAYLFSYKDYVNSKYGFSTSDEASETRYIYATDYAKAYGAFSDNEGRSRVWTRSSAGRISVECIKETGSISGTNMYLSSHFERYWTGEKYDGMIVYEDNYCGVQPAITFNSHPQ